MKCFKCSKKVRKFDFNQCKCEKNFCNDCRPYYNHNCSYNYKNDKKEILTEQNPVVIKPQVVQI